MSVFAFSRQDGVAETRLAGFCQVKSQQNGCGCSNSEACVAVSRRDKLWAGNGGQKGLAGVLGRIWRLVGAFVATKVLARQDYGKRHGHSFL